MSKQKMTVAWTREVTFEMRDGYLQSECILKVNPTRSANGINVDTEEKNLVFVSPV